MEPDLKRMLAETNKVAGLKEVERCIKSDKIRCVVVAQDADQHIKRKLAELSAAKNVRMIFTKSKEELGKEAGLNVGCAAVGFLKQ